MNKHFLLISLLFIIFSCKQQKVQLIRIEGTLRPVNSEIEKDSSINYIISPFKEKLETKMNKVLAYASSDFYKNRDKTETRIGNFMADLCYKHANPLFFEQSGKNIDFVLLNYGGIRSGIAKGNVTSKTAYEIMPFENNIVVAELNYEKLQELFNYLKNSNVAHPVSKHLKIVVENNIITTVLIKGEEVNKNKTYHILTSDYLQRGGDRMNFFKDPIKLYDLNYKIRTAIIDELTEIDTVHAIEDGRFIRQ